MSIDPTSIRAQLRKKMIADRQSTIRDHGLETFDQGYLLYRGLDNEQDIVIKDAFLPAVDAVNVSEFLVHLTQDWWQARRSFTPADGQTPRLAVAGLYARYLPEVGLDYLFEFANDDLSGDGPIMCWRVDPTGRAARLSLPTDEAMFHGQTGTYFNLRAGWRSLISDYASERFLLVEDVEPGYVIGVRTRDSAYDDPMTRPDPELEAAFSQYVDYDFDVVEFLGSADAVGYPFAGGRLDEWLEPSVDGVDLATVDLFILASAKRFIAAIGETCALRSVTLSVDEIDEDLTGQFSVSRGLSIELDLGLAFVRTLHTGRSFSAGIRDFVTPTLAALEDALDLLDLLDARLPDYRIQVSDGGTLSIRDKAVNQLVGQWPIFALTGRAQARGRAFADSVLRFLGFDPETGRITSQDFVLGVCETCGSDARIGKVIRPTSSLGVDPDAVLGVAIGDHTVYFTQECPVHVHPFLPRPTFTVARLEQLYQDGLADADFGLVSHRSLAPQLPASLIIGYDAGSLILEPRRIQGVMEALGLDGDEVYAYGFFPDALILAERPLTAADSIAAKHWSREAVSVAFPSRAWPLDVSRKIALDGQVIGTVTRLS
ncbi:MAG: hypothetical protein VX589_20930 [Myxococcota bacterium]|nr:hypothetical protein [Myxococcota bacterium]